MPALAADAISPEVAPNRRPDYPVHPILVSRWSPRAMSGEPLPDRDLMTLFEAARWAPSSFNEQPWRMIYARRDTPRWQTFLDLLVPGNREWCVNAAVLVVFVSRKTFTLNNKPNLVHTFDCGSAWENLALQASVMGLVAHGMAGFDREKARRELGVPDEFDVEAMCAIGRRGRKEDLPPHLREREVVSGRKPVKDIIAEGRFVA